MLDHFLKADGLEPTRGWLRQLDGQGAAKVDKEAAPIERIARAWARESQMAALPALAHSLKFHELGLPVPQGPSGRAWRTR
jgi:hypothetical protein